MVLDIGRIKHRADLMHRSTASNGVAVASNWILSADGLKNVVWTPRDAPGGGSVSYGSNANDVSSHSAGGASSLVARADHVHFGMRSLSANGSNSLSGNVNLQAGSGIALGVAGQTISILNIGQGGASGGGGTTITTKDEGSTLSSAVTTLDFTGSGVTASGAGATTTVNIPGGGSSSPFLEQATLEATYGDDFAVATLDAKWTLRNIATALLQGAQGDGSELWMDLTGGSADRMIYQSGITNKSEMDLIIGLSNFSLGGNTSQTAVFLLNSSGTGVGAQYSPGDNGLCLTAITTYAASSQLKTQITTPVGDLYAGQRYWLRLVKRGLIYFAQMSLDGINWSMSTSGSSQSFTPDRFGFGRVLIATSPHQVAVPRFNVENYFNVGNNLCITPTSGTATASASSQFSGSFTPAHAVDGNTADGWAASGTGDTPTFWQMTWSVGQTLNRVRILVRSNSADNFGSGHIEFSDGSFVPLRQLMIGGLWYFVDFATKTGITTMKIVSDAGKAGNPGFAEVEAYLAS